MNEYNNKNNLTIPIPPRHIVEKFRFQFIEASRDQINVIALTAMSDIAVLGVTKSLGFPYNLIGYGVIVGTAALYYKYAWTHEKLNETKTMLQYYYYKRKGLMNISDTDTYEVIKTLFPYEVKDIQDGIIHFGNNVYGAILELGTRKMSPEEVAEFTPVIERLINSLPPELIFKVRAKTVLTSENLLEKLVFERLQHVKTKEEKALLFSLYDKSQKNDNNTTWTHALFVGIRSNDDEIKEYVNTIMPGITSMLASSKILATHTVDPIKILGHYSSDFAMYEDNNDKQALMLVPKLSKMLNPISQMIHGSVKFEEDQIVFDGEFFGTVMLVGLPENMVGGWPDNVDGQVLNKLYALSDAKDHTIEFNVTIDPIESGDSVEEIKQVINSIEINELSNKTTSNLRLLSHSKYKYGLLLEQLQDGAVHMNDVTYIVTVRAKTREKLVAGVSRVRAVLRAYSIKTRKAKGDVKDIFKATRFFPIRYNKFSTTMPTEALARVLPIMNGMSNTSSSVMGKYCVYFADDIKTGIEYIFDLGKMGACHGIWLGATRSGKTTGLGAIGARAVAAGFRIFYITIKPDETTNYINMANAMNGEIIYLGRGKKNINPLEILHDPSMTFDPKQTFFQHITILKGFINQLCSSRNSSDNLNTIQLAYAERTLMRLYAKFGIVPTDPTTWKQEKQPTLIDLYNIWNADKDSDSRESVQAAVLESRTTSLTHNWDFLSQKTTISLDKDYIVIDLSALPGDLITAMNYFMTAIIGLRFRADVKRKNIIMIDEGGAFMRSGLGSDLIKIVTQGGSQGVALWFATQQFTDANEISAELLNNSFIRVVFGNNTEVPPVAAALSLNKSDQNFLSSCTKPGQMLIQMKSPFNQSYHCELNLSELESEILFGKKQQHESDFKFLVPALADFAKDRGFIIADWVMRTNETAKFTKDLIKEQIQRAVGAGKVWAYIPNTLIRDNGLIQNQSPDHYYTVAAIAGWLIERGISAVVSDTQGADIVVAWKNGKTLGIEYQTSLPDNNRPDIVMEKWKNGENKYSKLLFVSDTEGVKELKNIMKTSDNIIPRGTKLEVALNELIAQNQN